MKKRIKEAVLNLLEKVQNRDEGVTLIELLAVIVILAIIAAVAVPVILNSISTSKINATEQSESVIAEAFNRYAADHDGQFPSSYDETDLTHASTTNGTTTGPYLQSVPKDAYGGSFSITSTSTGFTITSSQKSIYMSNAQSSPTVGNSTNNTTNNNTVNG